MGRLTHVQGGPKRIHKLEAAILVALTQVVLGVAVALGVLAFLGLPLFGFALGHTHQLLVEAAISNEGLLGV